MTIVRSAVVQDCPIVFDREATLKKVRHLVKQAADRGAVLVLMPEAFVSGYPTGLDFGARVGLRQPKGREDSDAITKVVWTCLVRPVRH